MIVHISRAGDVRMLISELSPDMVRLMDAFWPGPLTIVTLKNPNVPDAVTAGLNTVAIRLPENKIASELIRRAGTPIAAPSANLSGKPSPTRGEHVLSDLFGLVDVILIGNNCKFGIESTVLDISGNRPVILRPGIIGPGEIASVLGKSVELHPSLYHSSDSAEALTVSRSVSADDDKAANADGGACDPTAADDDNATDADSVPRSPGMKYRHYAPKAEMIVLEGNPEMVRLELNRLKILNEKLGRRVGTILFEEDAFLNAAYSLFADLRALDDEGVDLIIAGAISQHDSVGFAVMNRMKKAAGYNIIKI
jgi:L-threonylcarbamoyladenylate synthase